MPKSKSKNHSYVLPSKTNLSLPLKPKQTQNCTPPQPNPCPVDYQQPQVTSSFCQTYWPILCRFIILSCLFSIQTLWPVKPIQTLLLCYYLKKFLKIFENQLSAKACLYLSFSLSFCGYFILVFVISLWSFWYFFVDGCRVLIQIWKCQHKPYLHICPPGSVKKI